jgi:hypothetical protein
MHTGLNDAEWLVLPSCFALGDPDGRYPDGDGLRVLPDPAEELKDLSQGLHIVLGFASRCHSDLNPKNFRPALNAGGIDTNGPAFEPLDIRFADFLGAMKNGDEIAAAWTNKMATGWYYRNEGGQMLKAWREIPRTVACNIGPQPAVHERLPVGNQPAPLSPDIRPAVATQVTASQHIAVGRGALHFRRRYRSRPDFLSGCFLTGLTGLRRIAVVCDDARYYSGSGGKRSSRTCRDRHQSCKTL